MSAPYIPPKNADFATWSANFAAVIAAAPATYGLAAGDAAAITAANAAWQTAYALSINPATRTPVTVAAAQVQKASTLLTERSYAIIIGANQGVSSGAKTAAGLTNRATGRTPIPAPGTVPILGFVGATPLQSTLKFADTSTPTTKAKPFGSIQMELWIDIEISSVPGTLAAAKFYGLITKTPFAVNFGSGDVGKVATYYARWTTRRGLFGPWSAALAHVIV